LEVYVHVEATPDGIATAAQALGGKVFRADELGEMVEGKIVDAMQAVAARHTMDSLHENRGKYVEDIASLVADSMAHNGLAIESVSLKRLDQTPFHALDENNAFNAVGMRRLAEIIATNKKQRAEIETDADVSVRQSQLEAVKRRLVIEQEEEEAQIAQRNAIDTRKAESRAEISEREAQAERRAEQARIGREQEVRRAEIERDRALRRLDVEARLATELRVRDNAIELARKQAEEALALAEAEQARATEVLAREATETEKERAAAERVRSISNVRAREQTEVDAARTRSESSTIIARARAESEASNLRTEAMKAQMLAESEGRSAIIEAENNLANEVIRMKLDMHKLDRLPELVGQMMKPVEKIDSIRINQVSGFGNTGGNGAGAPDKPLVNQAVDSILGMALQLPALKRLGEEIGINVGDGLEGIAAAADGSGGQPENANRQGAQPGRQDSETNDNEQENDTT
ncbi:MAG: flotillin domain-containing protein, partial [Gammaproteobacteria bacterium]